MKSAFSRSSLAALALLGVVCLFGCQKKEESMTTSETNSSETTTPGGQAAAPETTATPAPTSTPAPMPAPLPAGHIEVQHVLIGFVGSVPGKGITRTQEEAKTLAYEVLARAKKGDDFGQLVQQNTDDQYPGIYRLADRGVQADQAQGEYPRDGMVKGFSDVAFSLKQGEVGIADYGKPASPFGWHIIKRLE